MRGVILFLLFLILISAPAFARCEAVEFWRMDSKAASHSADPKFLRRYARAAVELNFWGIADRALEQLIQVTDDREAKITRLVTLYRLGEYRTATLYGQEINLVCSGDLRYHNNLAFSYLALGDTKNAIYHIDTAYGMDPSNETLKLNRALIRYGIGDLQYAEKELAKILKDNPQNLHAENNLAVIRFDGGDLVTSQAGFLKAASGLQIASLNSALIYYKTGAYSESLAILEKFEDSSNLFYIKLKTALLIALDRNRDAYFLALQGLNIKPNSEVMLQLAGIAIFNLENYQDATSFFIRTLYLNPASISAKNNLALSFKKRALYSKAFMILNDALEDAPENPTLIFNLGKLYEETGKTSEAIERYKQFLQLSEDPIERAEVEQNIKKLEEKPTERVVEDF